MHKPLHPDISSDDSALITNCGRVKKAIVAKTFDTLFLKKALLDSNVSITFILTSLNNHPCKNLSSHLYMYFGNYQYSSENNVFYNSSDMILCK